MFCVLIILLLIFFKDMKSREDDFVSIMCLDGEKVGMRLIVDKQRNLFGCQLCSFNILCFVCAHVNLNLDNIDT